MNNTKKLETKDYGLISIMGFLIGLLSLPVLNNIKLSSLQINFQNSVIIVLGFTIFANFALWISYLISRWIKFFLELAKFCATGALNTLINLGILNTLITYSGYAAGYWYVIFTATAFIVASINSYFWNKYWTFGARNEANVKEFSQFFIVSLVGLGLSVGVASLIVNVVGAPGGISPERWANVGALAATVVSLAWNFIGYKFIVFKK